jgi:hypothetical protein
MVSSSTEHSTKDPKQKTELVSLGTCRLNFLAQEKIIIIIIHIRGGLLETFILVVQ